MYATQEVLARSATDSVDHQYLSLGIQLEEVSASDARMKMVEEYVVVVVVHVVITVWCCCVHAMLLVQSRMIRSIAQFQYNLDCAWLECTPTQRACDAADVLASSPMSIRVVCGSQGLYVC